MRIRFFTPVTQLPQQPEALPTLEVTPTKAADEEMIYKECCDLEDRSSLYEEDDSTSIDDEDDLSLDNISEEEKASLPEMSND